MVHRYLTEERSGAPGERHGGRVSEAFRDREPDEIIATNVQAEIHNHGVCPLVSNRVRTSSRIWLSTAYDVAIAESENSL